MLRYVIETKQAKEKIMSTCLRTTIDENKIPYDVIRFATSAKHAKKTNGDAVRVNLNIYVKDTWDVRSITFDQKEWEELKKSIDEGFAEFPSHPD